MIEFEAWGRKVHTPHSSSDFFCHCHLASCLVGLSFFGVEGTTEGKRLADRQSALFLDGRPAFGECSGE